MKLINGKKCSPDCSPVKTTLSVLGGKWKPLILYVLRDNPHRFSAINREINGITQKMLTSQLRELEADGLVNRKIYPEIPPKVEYSITDYGRTLQPILKSMNEWGLKHEQRNIRKFPKSNYFTNGKSDVRIKQ